MLTGLTAEGRQYALVTGNYWAFTLTDGALRMLVVLHFHQLGYGALAIALLFVFYEFFGIVTNLVGGWLGAHYGLNRTMNTGLALQMLALAMLLVPAAWLTVPWVMAAQALSGIAKDLNKMSAKSAIKTLVPATAQGRLYQWVALLTGSKNALKGAGFFMGGALLMGLGFRGALLTMVMGLAAVWCVSVLRLRGDLGRVAHKPKFTEVFSRNSAINILAASRLFLFAARDVWFVVALPVYLSAVLGWNHTQVGAFLALWVIGYGAVQALAPRLTGGQPGRSSVVGLGVALALIPGGMALALAHGYSPALTLMVGLGLFGLVFALNSAVHSYLIVRHARAQGASLDVGFYYMANAAGRLAGTLLSGALYQHWGMTVCLWASAVMVVMTVSLSVMMPVNGER